MTTQWLTFGQTLDHYAQTAPDEIVISCARTDGSLDAISRQQLRTRSNTLARVLIERGVNVGDLVPIILPTCVDFLVATAAILKAGGTPMPVSNRVPDTECSGLLSLAAPKVIFADRDWGIPCIDPTLTGDSTTETDLTTVRASDPIKALSSGGSTGKPKLILTAGPFLSPFGENPIALALRLETGGLKYSPGPLYHNGPFWFSLNMLINGGRILLNERFDARRALELIEQAKPTILNLVPTMMQRMLRDEYWETADMSSIRTVWHLAAPCPPWAKEGFINKLGGEKVLELWAATEGTGMTALDGNEWLAHKGSVGKPIGTEVLILDADRNPLPTGEVGEIFTCMSGQPANYRYLGAEPLETAEGNYASVGDLGWLDEDGYLYLADRRTDLIISGGANIFPAEVEAVISQHPAVSDVAVIGLADADLGRRVHAIVTLHNDAESVTGDELLALCAQHLLRYKVPRSLEFVPELPRTEAGKIRRSALRDARES